MSSDVAVVGGGVIGCAVAWFLAREGASVTILERDALGDHASGVAAGMLLPIGEAEGRNPFLAWGMRSLERFPDLAGELRERTGIDVEYVPSGALRVARSPDEALELRERAERFEDLGTRFWDAGDARAAVPHLSADTVGALWSPREGHVRSALLTRAYGAAAAGLGARIETGVSATGLLRDGDRVCGVKTTAGDHPSAAVVLCMGAWTATGAAWMGALGRLSVEPVRGQILSLDSPPGLPISTIVWSPGIYVVPRPDGTVTVGATEERVGFDCRVTARGAAHLLRAAADLVPSLADATLRDARAGLRPATPDLLPAIGAVPGAPGLVVATGHHRNGVLLSPVTGQLVADLVMGKGIPPDAAPFSPDRYLA